MRTHRVAGLALGASALVLVLALMTAGCGGGKAVVSTTTTTTSTPATSPASQSDIALEIPTSGPGGFNYTQGTYLEGFEFTTKTSISVTALGAYDSNLATTLGQTETFAAVPVAIWDLTNNTEVANTNVTSSDPPTGIYRYATLSSPVTLNTTDTYAVVWVSLTNYYVASPVLDESDVNPSITYLGFASYGPGGLTQTATMVEPNWFYTVAQNGNAAIGYDLSANFILKTSTSASTSTSTSVPSTGVTLALGMNNPAQGDCTTNTSEAATSVGSVVITVTSSSFQADIQVQSGTPDTTFAIFMQQVPGGCPLQAANGGTLTTDSAGHGQADATVPLVAGATTFFVQLVPPSSSGAPEYTSDRTSPST